MVVVGQIHSVSLSGNQRTDWQQTILPVPAGEFRPGVVRHLVSDGMPGGVTPVMWWPEGRLNDDGSCRWIRVKHKVHLAAGIPLGAQDPVSGQLFAVYDNHTRKVVSIRDRLTSDPAPPAFASLDDANAATLNRVVGGTAPPITFRLVFSGYNSWDYPNLHTCAVSFGLLTSPPGASDWNVEELDLYPLVGSVDAPIVRKFRNGFRLPENLGLNEFIVELEWEIPSSPETGPDPDEWRHIKYSLKIIRSLCTDAEGFAQSMPLGFVFFSPLVVQIINCDSVMIYSSALNCSQSNPALFADHSYTLVDPALPANIPGQYPTFAALGNAVVNTPITGAQCFAGMDPGVCLWRNGILMVRDGSPGTIPAATLMACRDAISGDSMSISLGYRDGYPATGEVFHDHWGIGGETIKWRSNNKTYPARFLTNNDNAYAVTCSIALNGYNAVLRGDPYAGSVNYQPKNTVQQGGFSPSFGINHLYWLAGAACPDTRGPEIEALREITRSYSFYRLRNRVQVNVYDPQWLISHVDPNHPNAGDTRVFMGQYNDRDEIFYPPVALYGQGLWLGLWPRPTDRFMPTRSRLVNSGDGVKKTVGGEGAHYYSTPSFNLFLVNGFSAAREHLENLAYVLNPAGAHTLSERCFDERSSVIPAYTRNVSSLDMTREYAPIGPRSYGRFMFRYIVDYCLTGDARIRARALRLWECSGQGLNRGQHDHWTNRKNLLAGYGPDQPGFYPDFESGETIFTGGESPLENLVTIAAGSGGSHDSNVVNGIACGQAGPALARRWAGRNPLYPDAGTPAVANVPDGPNYCVRYGRKWWQQFYPELVCELIYKHFYNPTLPATHPANVTPQRAHFLFIKYAFSESQHWSTSEWHPLTGRYSTLDGTIIHPYLRIWGTGADTVQDRHAFDAQVGINDPNYRRPLDAVHRRWFTGPDIQPGGLFNGWYPHELNGENWGEGGAHPLNYTINFVVMWVASYRFADEWANRTGDQRAIAWKNHVGDMLRRAFPNPAPDVAPSFGWGIGGYEGFTSTVTSGEGYFRNGNLFEYIYDLYPDHPTGPVTIDLNASQAGGLIRLQCGTGFSAVGESVGFEVVVDITQDINFDLAEHNPNITDPPSPHFEVGSFLADNTVSLSQKIGLHLEHRRALTPGPGQDPAEPPGYELFEDFSVTPVISNDFRLLEDIALDLEHSRTPPSGPLFVDFDVQLAAHGAGQSLGEIDFDLEIKHGDSFIVSLERVSVTTQTDPRRVYAYTIKLQSRPEQIHPEVYAGNDVYFLFTLVDSQGSAVDLSTGVTRIIWRFYKDETSGSQILELSLGAGITVNNGPAGQITVDLEGDLTQDFQAKLYHECELTLNGSDTTLFNGPITFTRTFIR